MSKNDPPLTHILTHPIHPTTFTTHPIGEGVSANHKSSNRIELSWSVQDLFDFYWYDMTPPIDPHINPNHPPNHPYTHPIGGGGGVSANHKSSNRIELFSIRSRLSSCCPHVVSMWSPHPRGPDVVSTLSSCCPHVVSMLSPCGVHIPMVPMLSPRCPHVVSTSPWFPCCLHIVLMLSPCCPHMVCTSP